MIESTFFAPGKLFIAGEYTVLFGGFALLIPLKLGIQVSLKPSPIWMIHNPSFQTENKTYSSLQTMPESNVRFTLEWFEQYIMSFGKTLHPCSIQIESSLSSHAEKYGLGSSGAIIIALLGALLKAHEITFSPLHLFQLGVLVSYQHGVVQSFADLAVSAYQTSIIYRAPQIKIEKKNQGLSLLKLTWPSLHIEPWTTTFQHPWVVFTNQAADSKRIVPQVLAGLTLSEWKDKTHQVDTWIEHFINDVKIESIDPLNHLLMSMDTNQVMYIPAMKKIISIAQRNFAVSKPSGAGGGDCILIWPSEKTNVTLLKQDLEPQFRILSVF